MTEKRVLITAQTVNNWTSDVPNTGLGCLYDGFEVEVGRKSVSAKSAKRTALTGFWPTSTSKTRVERTQTLVGQKTSPITYCLSDDQNKFFVILRGMFCL